MLVAPILLLTALGTPGLSPPSPAETLRYAVRLGEGRVGTVVSIRSVDTTGRIHRVERAEMTLAREGQVIRLEEEIASVEDRSGRLLRLEIIRRGLGPRRWLDRVERIGEQWRRVRDRGDSPVTDTLAWADLLGPTGIGRRLTGRSDSVAFLDLDPIEIRPRKVVARRVGRETLGEGPTAVSCSVYRLVDSTASSDVLQWRDAEGDLWREEEKSLGWTLEREELVVPEEIQPFETMELGRLALEGSPPSDPPCSLLLIPIEGEGGMDAPPPIREGLGQEVTPDAETGGWRILRTEAAPPATTEADRTAWAAEHTLAGPLRAGLIVDADAPEIRRFAEEATRGAKSPTEEALRLERAVHDVIRVLDLRTVFATASQTLAQRQGDCTEHAILLAACCRARGIPARLVAGVVPVGDRMGFHLWTEVFLGRWIGLDATLGQGRPAPCALAIQHWEQPEEGIGGFSRAIQQLIGRYRFRIAGGE